MNVSSMFSAAVVVTGLATTGTALQGPIPGAPGAEPNLDGLWARTNVVEGVHHDGVSQETAYGRDLGADVEPLAIGAIDPRFDKNTLRGSFFVADRTIEGSQIADADGVKDTLKHEAKNIPGVHV